MKGTIKVLKEGYGFITSEETDGDTFFHANNMQGVEFNDLVVGNELEFEVGEGNNGKMQAVNVTLVA
jgi:CspA family cold shock protein